MPPRKPKASRASKIFTKLDVDGNKSMEHEEMAEFISSQDDLWDKLSKQLKLPKFKATQAATLVAMELATGLPGEMALNFALTKDQFKTFHANYFKNPEGYEEFFQRIVFACYDDDNSGCLDHDELESFLDAIYETRDVRKGRINLSSKEEMKALILAKFDDDEGGTLDFNEIRKILSGGAKGLEELKEEAEAEGFDVSKQLNYIHEEKKRKSKENVLKRTASGDKHQRKGNKNLHTIGEASGEATFCDFIEQKLGTNCKKCVIS